MASKPTGDGLERQDSPGAAGASSDGQTEGASPVSARVMVIDDYALVRDGLVASINATPHMSVVGSGSCFHEARGETSESDPTVVLIEADLSRQDGISLAFGIRYLWPGARSILLLTQVRDRLIGRAVDAGIPGIVSKRDDLASLMTAINVVAGGGRYYSTEVYDRLTAVVDYRSGSTTQRVRSSSLTPREIEVLIVLADGRSVKQAADYLHLAVATVDSHKTQIMKKLDLHTIVALTRYAIREGLTSA
jgi:DNA-binding NarL/FixJ family response regulator